MKSGGRTTLDVEDQTDSGVSAMERRDAETIVTGPARARRLLWFIAILIGIALVVVTVWVAVPREVQRPTYQQILDGGRDLDGDGFPDIFPQLDSARPVEILDVLLDMEYQPDPYGQPSPFVTVWFAYRNGVWPVLNEWAKAFALVEDDLGAYTSGDKILLVGSIARETFNNITYETITWRLVGGTGRISPPTVSLENVTVPGLQYAVEVDNVTRANTLIHYRILLLEGGQGIDLLDLSEGSDAIFTRYEDRNRDGHLSLGDRIILEGLAPGSYEVLVQYALREVGRFPFSLP